MISDTVSVNDMDFIKRDNTHTQLLFLDKRNHPIPKTYCKSLEK